MKLTLTQQFQDYLKSLGVDFSMLLEKAGLPNKTWQEDIVLTDLEHYRLLLAFDDVMTEEAICNLSRIEHIQLFIPAFFCSAICPKWIGSYRAFCSLQAFGGTD